MIDWLLELAIASDCTPSCCFTCSACSLVEFFVHVGVNELADAATDSVHQGLDEILLDADARFRGAKRGCRVGHGGYGRIHHPNDLFQILQIGGAVG